MGTTFVAGVYGVGKSTLCDTLAVSLGIPAYSAGDLISQANGEKYGANKVVQDKEKNQDILAIKVAEKLEEYSSILLAGHFCIFDKENRVDKLPDTVFEKLQIEQILLLEADVNQIIYNLNNRDGKKYMQENLSMLLAEERSMAMKISELLNIPLYIHQMSFTKTDEETCIKFINERGVKE